MSKTAKVDLPKMEFSAPFRGTHGIECLEYKVLVKPAEEKGYVELKGGFKLHKPDETKERDEHATMEGEVVAISPLAFSYEEGAPKPNVGETVVFQRYAGLVIVGADGIKYRLMNDKDVVAVRRSA